MPNVAFDKQSDVTATLTVSLTKEELENKLKSELKKARKTANLRGFRKGKAPLSALRKLMGNEILGRLLDQEINDSLFGYIEENEVDIIFSPMPIEQEQIDVDAKNVKDLNLAYELALRPSFELSIPTETFERFQLNVDDAFVDERLLALRRQFAESEDVESDIKENDILTVAFTELVDGAPKEDGISNETKLFVDALEEDVVEQLKGQDVGFITEVDINAIEKDATETYVRKYLLELEDEDTTFEPTFQLEVKNISRRDPAELDEAFFEKFDPSGTVTDEAALREKIQSDNAEGFNKQGNSMVDYAVQKALVEGTEIELAHDFLQRVHAEGSEQSYERFVRGIRWMLIRNAYLKQEDLEITQEDLRAATTNQLVGMMGGQRPDWLNDEFIDNYSARVLQDEKQRDELIYQVTETKIMDSLREKVSITDIPLSADEFNAKIEAFNALYQADEEE
ncbi:MAG: trigger factor [Bacteroidota bacterium]